MADERFFQGLYENSIDILETVPKSDLHNHAGRGGTISYIGRWANVTIEPPKEPFDSLTEMDEWLNEHVKIHCPGLAGYLKRVEAAFAQAEKDSIKVLVLSSSIDEIDALGSLDTFIKTMSTFRQNFARDIVFLPDLTVGYMPDADIEYGRLDEILSSGWFHGIDIINYQKHQSMAQLKRTCRKARDCGLLLKAHIGEYDGADNVYRYAEELELDQIQHGIAAAESPQIMAWLAKHKIQLNVCPTSNIKLKRSESYKSHQIRRLVDYGVPVTINTDDLLIFNATVSQEYLNLYKAGTLTAEELDIIRKTGLGNSLYLN
jgi:adenosine deaminase